MKKIFIIILLFSAFKSNSQTYKWYALRTNADRTVDTLFTKLGTLEDSVFLRSGGTYVIRSIEYYKHTNQTVSSTWLDYRKRYDGIYVNTLKQPNDTYDAAAWNGSTEAPTKDAVRDKIESLGSGGTKSKGFFLESPTSSEAVDMWQTPVAITVSSLKAILRGSSPSVTYNIKFGTDITSATSVFTSDITCTSITTGCSNSSGFNDATIPAGSFIWIVTTAASGTITSIGFTLNYTED